MELIDSNEWFLSPTKVPVHPAVTEGHSPKNVREQLIYRWRNKVSEKVVCLQIILRKGNTACFVGLASFANLQRFTSDVPLIFQGV